MADIYKYIDYRLFLKEALKALKKGGPALTQRQILEKMGISSTGFLANVLSGKKGLTVSQAKSLAAILGLNSNEASYFKYMVHFSKAKSLDDKNDFYETLNGLRQKKLKKLDKKQLSLFSNWYFVVVREIIDITEFKDDFKSLAKMVTPAITPGQAKKAVEMLVTLGLIKKGAGGVYRQSNSLLTTGDEVHSFHVANFNRKMTDLEKNVIDNVPARERDLSGLTMGLSSAGFKELKTEIQALRKKALQIAERDNNPERVFRCNFKLFPVSRKMGEA